MEINKIYCESNLDTMKRMPNNFVDLVITSPPYNIIRPNSTDRGYDVYKDGISNDEYISWTLDIFKGFNNVLKKNGIVLYNMSYGTENTILMSLVVADLIRKSDFTLADIIVWKKKTATPNNVSHNKLTRIVEYVYVFCRKSEFESYNCNKKELSKRETGQSIYENIFNFITANNNDESNNLNKATFSTEFVRKLFKIYAKENSLIYDPFMGTGTTEKACIIDKHNFIGSELSSSQVDYANKRLKPYLGQQTLF
jgi:site-specific DNA-methyltransferase (adenine-specific)/modification methylase